MEIKAKNEKSSPGIKVKDEKGYTYELDRSLGQGKSFAWDDNWLLDAKQDWYDRVRGATPAELELADYCRSNAPKHEEWAKISFCPNCEKDAAIHIKDYICVSCRAQI